MALTQKNNEYTIDDIYALPDGQRAELIDGQMYMMTPPGRRHQLILGFLYRKIADFDDMVKNYPEEVEEQVDKIKKVL